MNPDAAQSKDGFDVAYIARLARLALGDEERRRLQGQLEHILQYVEELRNVDVSGVEPMAHATDATNVFRADEPRPCLDHDAAMANAPESRLGQFVVPPIIE